MRLNAVQVRVLGALIEKEIATPETYPLSMNALLAACSQRSSRDPVMELAEDEVRQALHGLDELGLTSVVRDSRVAKYEHRIRTVLQLRRDETAILCLLFLRGPQTPGELRSRSERLFAFDDLDAVQSTLERMAARAIAGSTEDAGEATTGPLVVLLPRQPGSREARWAHLLGGPVEVTAGLRSEPAARASASSDGIAERVAELEAQVISLRATVDELHAQIVALQPQGANPD